MFLCGLMACTVCACSKHADEQEISADFCGHIPLFTLSPDFIVYADSENLDDIVMDNDAGFGVSVNMAIGDSLYHLMGERGVRKKRILHGGMMDEGWSCRYSYLFQPSDWIQPDYDDSLWETGCGPFGSLSDEMIPWSFRNLYIRRYFDCDSLILSQDSIVVDYCIDGKAELYINGRFIQNISGNGKLQKAYLPSVTAFLKKGTNVFAMKCENESRSSDAVVDFGMSLCCSEPVIDAELTKVSATSEVSRLNFDCGPVAVELSFIAPHWNYGCHPVNYMVIKTSSEVVKNCNLDLQVNFNMKHIFDSFQKEKLRGYGDFIICSNSDASLFLSPAFKSGWGDFYFGDMSKQAEISENEGIISVSAKANGNLDMTLYAGYDDGYVLQLFGQNIRPAWNRNGKKTIADIVKKDARKIEHYSEAADSLDDVSLRLLKPRLRLGVDDNGELVYTSGMYVSRMTMMSDIADTLAMYGERELLEGMMNPIIMYAESERWNPPFCPPDAGACPMAMHRVSDDMDYMWITRRALDIVADIDSLAGNDKYSRKHKKLISKWENFVGEY